ncbi:MAG TPA: transglutaminase family protein [Bryobacteraceae bacterium]|nr:transglutaminase family protein [Bryobacteraceae bacterium]
MRIAVTHSTRFLYDAPVYLGPHTIRLQPREDGSQRLRQQQLIVLPTPAGQAQQLDQEGNVALQVWFNAPTTELAVLSSFQVETLRENPFDFLLPPAAEMALPMKYPPAVAPALAHYTNGVPADRAVREFAETLAAAAGRQAMPFLMSLTETLCRDWRQVLRPEGASHPPATTLELGEGSCRDLAALFAEAARAQGLAARFVSGYERAAAMEEHAYMHAWAEVYIPGGGWRAYDPSRGVAVSTMHVAVAAAVNPEMAAPISGLYMGKAQAKMQVAISMQVGE